MKKKTYFVRPQGDIEEVTDLLDRKKISYAVSREDNIIFANLFAPPADLEEVATVTDPVVRENKEWFFVCDDQNLTDVMGPFKNEDAARRAFVNFISWAGEFVNNDGERL